MYVHTHIQTYANMHMQHMFYAFKSYCVCVCVSSLLTILDIAWTNGNGLKQTTLQQFITSFLS
eukprot:m.209807 g.209807  ORF g.209807 m.209807 type:complete len:63 (-) comp13776_c0_seq1:8-196(-)